MKESVLKRLPSNIEALVSKTRQICWGPDSRGNYSNT